MLIIRAGIYKMFVKIANKEGLSKKQTDLGLPCLFRSFWQTTSVQNFRTLELLLLYDANKK